MDNILKLLLGVLAVSGLLAMLVPAESPVARPVASAPPPAAPPPPTVGEVTDGEEADQVEDEIDDAEFDGNYADDEDFRIGEPSIDGQPFGAGGETPTPNQDTVIAPTPDPQQPQPVPAEISANSGL